MPTDFKRDPKEWKSPPPKNNRLAELLETGGAWNDLDIEAVRRIEPTAPGEKGGWECTYKG